MALLIHPPRSADEGASGYISRVAEANRCYSFRDAQRLLAADAADSYERVALERQRLEHNAHIVRYCPECLAEGVVHWPALWELRLTVGCHRHHVWLRDTCHRCRAVLVWSVAGVGQCRCGARLAEAPSMPLPAQLEPLVSLWAALSDTSVPVPTGSWRSLRGLTHPQLDLLIRRLVGLAERSDSVRPSKWPGLYRVAIAGMVMCRAAELLRSPGGEFSQLIARLLNASQSHESIPSAIVGLLQLLKHQLPQAPTARYRRAIERSTAQHLWRPLTKRHHLLSDVAQERHDWIALAQAARELAVTPRYLKEVCHNLNVRAHTLHAPRVRQFWVIHRRDICVLRSAVTDSLNWEAGCRWLGITPRRARELVIKTRLRQALVDLPSGRRVWNSSRLDMWLAEFLPEQTASAAPDSEPVYAFDDVLRHLLPKYCLEAADFIGALESGQLKASARCPEKTGLAALAFDAMMTVLWVKATADERYGFSISSLATQLRVKYEVVSHWIHCGHLSATRYARLGTRITPRDLNVFLLRYVLPRELTGGARGATRKLVRQLAAQGVEPISGPTRDGCRQYLYRRVDLIAREWG